jgi:hypothetical protein
MEYILQSGRETLRERRSILDIQRQLSTNTQRPRVSAIARGAALPRTGDASGEYATDATEGAVPMGGARGPPEETTTCFMSDSRRAGWVEDREELVEASLVELLAGESGASSSSR